MNIAAVLDEMVTALGTIDGLNAYAFVPGAIVPPAAIVALPDQTFDLTYGRGGDRLSVPVTVLLARTPDRVNSRALAGYLAGSGDTSIKAALEGGTYTACDFVAVRSVNVDVITVGATDYLAATFTCDVAGSGD